MLCCMLFLPHLKRHSPTDNNYMYRHPVSTFPGSDSFEQFLPLMLVCTHDLMCRQSRSTATLHAQDQRADSPGPTVINGSVQLGPNAELPSAQLVPADALRPQPRTYAPSCLYAGERPCMSGHLFISLHMCATFSGGGQHL